MGWRGNQLMLQAGGRGEDWKVDGCLLVLGEHPKIIGGTPSSCWRFGDFLLFFIAAKS